MVMWILSAMKDAAYLRHDILVRATTHPALWAKEHERHRDFVDSVYAPAIRASRGYRG